MKQPATKARPTRKPPANGRPAPAYLALVARFPLRPLRSEKDYDAAVAIPRPPPDGCAYCHGTVGGGG